MQSHLFQRGTSIATTNGLSTNIDWKADVAGSMGLNVMHLKLGTLRQHACLRRIRDTPGRHLKPPCLIRVNNEDESGPESWNGEYEANIPNDQIG